MLNPTVKSPHEPDTTNKKQKQLKQKLSFHQIHILQTGTRVHQITSKIE